MKWYLRYTCIWCVLLQLCSPAEHSKMQGCWSILLGLHPQAPSRSGHLHYIEGAALLYLLFFLHGTSGDYNTCGAGLSTPGGKYFAGHWANYCILNVVSCTGAERWLPILAVWIMFVFSYTGCGTLYMKFSIPVFRHISHCSRVAVKWLHPSVHVKRLWTEFYEIRCWGSSFNICWSILILVKIKAKCWTLHDNIHASLQASPPCLVKYLF